MLNNSMSGIYRKGANAVMRGMFNRIRSSSGETIGETLVALLIGSLALAMLAGAIASGARIIIRSREKMADYYSNNNKITMEDTSVSSGQLDVSFKEESDTVYLVESQNNIIASSYTNSTFEGTDVISYSITGG